MKKILIALSLTLVIPGKIFSVSKKLVKYEKKLALRVIEQVELPAVLRTLEEVEKSGKYKVEKFKAKKLKFRKKQKGRVTQIKITDYPLITKNKITSVGSISRARRGVKPGWLIFNEKIIDIHTGKTISRAYKIPIKKGHKNTTIKKIVKKIQTMARTMARKKSAKK